LVGKTLVGMRIDDTIHAVDWLCGLKDVDPAAITAYGAGPLGMVVLHAAALDTRIKRVVVENSVVDYRMMVDQPIHRNISEVVLPGVLSKI
jgi:cephalosporin-C deacetylase-like acetyl esterase